MGTLAQRPITKKNTLSRLARNHLDRFSRSLRERLSWSWVLGLY